MLTMIITAFPYKNDITCFTKSFFSKRKRAINKGKSVVLGNRTTQVILQQRALVYLNTVIIFPTLA